jgi:hypothetical protein
LPSRAAEPGHEGEEHEKITAQSDHSSLIHLTYQRRVSARWDKHPTDGRRVDER